MRKGITLVEALIMVIIAGSCMVPILGTLNHGVSRANAVRLRSAMQNVAESKLNEIIDLCSYVGTTPIDEAITVPYPNAAFPEYNFIISIEVNTPVNLIEYDGSASGLDGPQEPNFREVSIVVRLQETEPDVEPVCLYTMLSKPKTPGDMIYAACPGTKTIKVISPKNHVLVDNYAAPALLADITQLTGISTLAAITSYVPLHLAVHPGGEWLAIKSTTQIFLMDIRANSLTRGNVWCIIDAIGTICANTAVENTGDPGETGTRLDRGIVFRSDGKYLFFTDRTGKIHAYNVPASLPGVAKWVAAAPFIGENQPIGFLELCDDQNLYVGYMNSGDSNHFKAFNTYSFQEETFSQPIYTHGKKSHQRSLTSSWGGHELFEMYCGFFLGRFNKWAPTDSNYGTLSGATYAANHDHRHNAPIVSPDNIWLMLPQATSGNQEHCGFFRLPLDTTTFSDNPGSWNRSAKTNSADLLTLARHSPWGKEGILKGITSKIYFPKWAEVAAGAAGNYNSADSMPVLDLTDIPSDVNCRIPAYAWVACADKSIQVIDLYGGGGRLDDSKKITLATAPLSFATTAGADVGVVCLDNIVQPHKIDHADGLATAMALTIPGGCKAVNAAYTLDRSLIVGVKSDGATSASGESTSAVNGVLVYKADDLGDLVTTVECGYALPSTFVVKEIIPMHRRDGAYVLFQDTTSSPNESALIWIEKSAHGGLGGSEGTIKHRIMYVWRGKLDGFPEGAPYKMALSPDDTTLALYDWTSTAGNGHQMIRLYDLNNQRFPMQEGLILNRYSSPTGSFAALPVDSILNLKTSLTKFNTNSPLNPAYPYNFYNSGSDLYTSSRTSRFFGTWYHPTFSALGLCGQDGSQFYFDGTYRSPATYNTGTLWSDGDSDETWGFNISTTAKASHFQGDYYSNNDAGENTAFAYSTTSLTSTPSHTNGTPITFSGGGGTWNTVPTAQMRALRFRPQLLKEIEFAMTTTWFGDPSTAADDITLPHENADSGDPDWFTMCFNRDTSRPVLFIINNTVGVDTLYGLGLFGEANWKTKSLTDATSWQIAVSPDGRRLILTSGTPNKAYLFDIAYAIPYVTPDLSVLTPTDIVLPAAPVSLAVRHFNSFSSAPNSYSTFDDTTRASNRCGIQTAVLAKGGIYIVGGSDGRQGAAQTKLDLFNPIDSTYDLALSNLPEEGRHSSVLAYNDVVFSVQGLRTSPTAGLVPYVQAYKISDNTWYTHNTAGMVMRNIQDNSNVDYSADVLAGCLTPYGLVFGGGNNSGGTTSIVYTYYPDARMDTTTPAKYGETLAMPPLPTAVRDHCFVTHFSRKDKKWYLYRIGGGTSDGGALDASIDRFNFDTNLWDATLDSEDTGLTEKGQPAACSWGDEIFIFGGSRSGARLNPPTAIAYNPDTGMFRQISNVKDSTGIDDTHTLMMSAVPCGPYIYLIDGASGVNDSGSGIRRIRRYKP
ncbi:MAG: hypothetical protein KKB51_00425 [Candidatus Riflebacteria bacterium]|nr:hypothetical protein [Candidatus Riflebacteria bacterium]